MNCCQVQSGGDRSHASLLSVVMFAGSISQMSDDAGGWKIQIQIPHAGGRLALVLSVI